LFDYLHFVPLVSGLMSIPTACTDALESTSRSTKRFRNDYRLLKLEVEESEECKLVSTRLYSEQFGERDRNAKTGGVMEPGQM
jgi:hypothetical protein